MTAPERKRPELLGGCSMVQVPQTHPSFQGIITWRNIPGSKWLGSPPIKSHLDYLEGEQAYLRDVLITNQWVINHLLNGMILQVPTKTMQ